MKNSELNFYSITLLVALLRQGFVEQAGFVPSTLALLVAGCWLLVAGCWLLENDRYYINAKIKFYTILTHLLK